MARVLETGLGLLALGGLAVVKFGLADDAAALFQRDEQPQYMSAANPWSNDYQPQERAASFSYRNCNAARAAGAAPVRYGEPGYGPHLDRDGDGIGCESYYGR